MIELEILGQKINLSDLKEARDKLKKLRDKLKEAGMPELLSDAQWQGGQSIMPSRAVGNTVTRLRTAGSTIFRPARRPKPNYQRSGVTPEGVKIEVYKALDEEFQKIPELDAVLKECLKLFPEIKDIEIRARNEGEASELSGALGKFRGSKAVILFVPNALWGKWRALKPVICHELCHVIDLENPDRVFEERADEKSKEQWRRMKELGQARCSEDVL